jgi:ABC-type Fe3+ transport system permease subunit
MSALLTVGLTYLRIRLEDCVAERSGNRFGASQRQSDLQTVGGWSFCSVITFIISGVSLGVVIPSSNFA